MADEADGPDKPVRCDFCKHERIDWRNEELLFSHQTDRGAVWCRVSVPIGRCAACGFAHATAEGDALMAEAVQQARDRLPPR
jgi:hypothetical protein